MNHSLEVPFSPLAIGENLLECELGPSATDWMVLDLDNTFKKYVAQLRMETTPPNPHAFVNFYSGFFSTLIVLLALSFKLHWITQ